MLVTGVCLTLLTVVVLTGLVGELLVRLEVLEVRVETKNERELDRIKKEMAGLERRLESGLENLKKTEADFNYQIFMLTKRIYGLQTAFKTGDAKYLVSEALHVRACHFSTFLFLVIPFTFSLTLF